MSRLSSGRAQVDGRLRRSCLSQRHEEVRAYGRVASAQLGGPEVRDWIRVPHLAAGPGYVTEVVRELTTAAFRELTANRDEITCDSRHQRRRRVAERAGFRLEAELRWDEWANDSSLRDTVVYALLAEGFHRVLPGANTS